MKKLMIGLVAAAGIGLATPALSQNVYFGAGPGGVGIGLGSGYGYGSGYRAYDDGYAPRYRAYRGYRSYGYDRGRNCRTRLIETRYGLRRVTRCW